MVIERVYLHGECNSVVSEEKTFARARTVKSNSSCLLARLHLALLYFTNTAVAGIGKFTAASVIVINRQIKLVAIITIQLKLKVEMI